MVTMWIIYTITLFLFLQSTFSFKFYFLGFRLLSFATDNSWHDDDKIQEWFSWIDTQKALVHEHISQTTNKRCDKTTTTRKRKRSREEKQNIRNVWRAIQINCCRLNGTPFNFIWFLSLWNRFYFSLFNVRVKCERHKRKHQLQIELDTQNRFYGHFMSIDSAAVVLSSTSDICFWFCCLFSFAHFETDKSKQTDWNTFWDHRSEFNSTIFALFSLFYARTFRCFFSSVNRVWSNANTLKKRQV